MATPFCFAKQCPRCVRPKPSAYAARGTCCARTMLAFVLLASLVVSFYHREETSGPRQPAPLRWARLSALSSPPVGSSLRSSLVSAQFRPSASTFAVTREERSDERQPSAAARERPRLFGFAKSGKPGTRSGNAPLGAFPSASPKAPWEAFPKLPAFLLRPFGPARLLRKLATKPQAFCFQSSSFVKPFCVA